MALVTVIIPFKIDRGWLKDAIASVPMCVELIQACGNGNWPQNFNKGLINATGDYIKFLHEDDMLTPNCIKDSLAAFKATGADFIHGNAFELHEHFGTKTEWHPPIAEPTFADLLHKNTIHSTTLMYKREIFDKIGGFNEDPKMYSFEEFEFNLRCLKAGFKIGYVDAFLATYRRHPRQIIRTVDTKTRQTYRNALVKQYKDDK